MTSNKWTKDIIPGLWIPSLTDDRLAVAISECIEADDLAALTIFQVEINFRSNYAIQLDAEHLAIMRTNFVKRVKEKSN